MSENDEVETDLEMYDGTMAVKAAASKPAEDFFVTSVVSK